MNNVLCVLHTSRNGHEISLSNRRIAWVSRGLKILISKNCSLLHIQKYLGRESRCAICTLMHPTSFIDWLLARPLLLLDAAGQTDRGPPKHMGHFVTLFFLAPLRPSSFLRHGLCTPVPLSHYSPCSFSFTSARPAKVTQLRLTCCRRHYSCWFLQGVFLCISLYIFSFLPNIIITQSQDISVN